VFPKEGKRIEFKPLGFLGTGRRGGRGSHRGEKIEWASRRSSLSLQGEILILKREKGKGEGRLLSMREGRASGDDEVTRGGDDFLEREGGTGAINGKGGWNQFRAAKRERCLPI